MKNKIVPIVGVALTIYGAIAIFQQSSLAIVNDDAAGEEVACQGDFFAQYGDINTARTVTINGVENPLFCEFVDSSQALSNFKNVERESLEEIALKYNLEELSSENWEEYQAASFDLGSQTLAGFFDIYENTKKNNEAVDFANSISSAYAFDSALESDVLGQLSFMLPYFSPLAEEYNSSTDAGSGISAHANIPNVSAAVSYAEKYAWNPNTAQYQYFSADCTNFVSQVLEAGGVTQAYSSSKYSGWWHKIVSGNHEQSISWINSDTFARYMGVGYTTNRILDLSMNIQVGDVLALDETSDGDWDHTGFVTYRNSAPGTYGSLTYYNFIIAQHTSNYNMWVSESGNHWEEYDYTYGGRGTYARVRR